MFRAPDSEGGRAGPRCGAGVGTVMWRACGRRGGLGELTEPGPPRPGEGGGRGCGPGRPEVRLPAPSAPARAASWAGAPQTPAERSLVGGGRGGAAGTPAPCGVCASGPALRRSVFLGARSPGASGALFPESRSRGARRHPRLLTPQPRSKGMLFPLTPQPETQESPSPTLLTRKQAGQRVTEQTDWA